MASALSMSMEIAPTVKFGHALSHASGKDVRKAVMVRASGRASEETKPAAAASMKAAIVPLLSSAIVASSIFGLSPVPENMSTFFPSSVAIAEEVAEAPAVTTPEERARQLAEVLKKKREEALAAAEAARAEKEAARAAKEAAIAAARGDAARQVEESRPSSSWFSQPAEPAPAPAPAAAPAPVKKAAPTPTAVEATKKKSKGGGFALFLSQFGVLAAYAGGVAALVLVPDEEWKKNEAKVADVLESAAEKLEELWETSRPVVEQATAVTKDFAVQAAPYVEKAIEASKPVVAKAVEAATPLAEQAVAKAKEAAEPLLSQAQEKVDELKENASSVLKSVEKKL